MKLPGINYGAVQQLAKPDPTQEANAAMLPYKYAESIAKTTYETTEHFQILQDQELALEQANKSNQVAGILNTLGEDKVAASQLPAEVLENYRNQEGYDAGQSGWVDGDEIISPHKIAQATYDWANKEINSIQGNVKSNRQQAMYGEALGETLSSAFSKANSGIKTSQIQALSDQTDIAVMNANAANNPALSFKLIKDAYSAGIYSPAGWQKKEAATIKYFQSRVKEEMRQIEVDIETAEVDGDEALAESLKVKHNESIKYWKGIHQNLLSDEQANEYALAFRSAQVKGEVASAVNFSLESPGGVDAALSTVLKMQKEQKIPDGMTPTAYNNIINQQLNRVNQRKSMLSDSGTDVAKQLKVIGAQNRTAIVFASGGLIPKTGPVKKDFDVAYLALQQRMDASPGMTLEQKRQEKYNYINTGGQLPKAIYDNFDSVRFQSTSKQVETVRDYVEFKQRSNGKVTAKYTGENKAYLEYLAKEIESGGNERDLPTAIEAAETIFVGNKFSAEYATNIESNADALKPKKMAKYLDDLVEGHFDYEVVRSAPQVTALYKNAWEHNFRDNLGKGATVDEARTAADDEVKSLFDVDFSDKRYSNGKLAVMPMSIVGDWAQPQFETMITEMFPDLVAEYGAEAFYTEADGLTTTETSPSWKIMIRTGTGDSNGFQPVVNPEQTKDGVSRPGRFRPDYNKTTMFKDELAQRDADIDSGKYYETLSNVITEVMGEKLAEGKTNASMSDVVGHALFSKRGSLMTSPDVKIVVDQVKKLVRNDPYFQTQGEDGTFFDHAKWNKAVKVIEKNAEATYNTLTNQRPSYGVNLRREYPGRGRQTNERVLKGQDAAAKEHDKKYKARQDADKKVKHDRLMGK